MRHRCPANGEAEAVDGDARDNAELHGRRDILRSAETAHSEEARDLCSASEKQQWPAAPAIDQRHRHDDGDKVARLVDRDHGEGIDAVKGLDVNGAILLGENLASNMKEEIGADRNKRALKVGAAPEISIDTLFVLFCQDGAEGIELSGNFVVGEAALAKQGERLDGLFFAAFDEEPSWRLWSMSAPSSRCNVFERGHLPPG